MEFNTKREEIHLFNFLTKDLLNPEDWPLDFMFEFIENDIEHVDSSKNSIDFILVFKRIEDQKYFKVHYNESEDGECDLNKKIAYEVFPRLVSKYIYR